MLLSPHFERLAHAGSDAVVVTPTRRLARALVREFDAWQVERGRRVWESPRIVPFGAFVDSLYDSAQHDPALTGVRAPLSATQERTLWEAVIEASDVPLASPGAAAQLAADAWSLAHQWRIADRLRHYALAGDTRVFAEWAADYERRGEQLGATDQARLPDVVGALIADGRLGVPADVVLAGFEELTPQQDALREAMASRGTRIELSRSRRERGDCRRMACFDSRDELARMADWVACRLAANPVARIGVVVPDLGARRRAVARALDAALAPDALLAPPDRPRPYTVSLGGSLADTPPVAAALHALRRVADELEFGDASALIRSPYVDFGSAVDRARFDFEWRRRSGRRVALDHLLAAARALHDVEPARLALEALDAWRRRSGAGTRRLSEWAALLMDGLRAVGFPGRETADSSEYQTLRRWQELMAEFAALGRVQAAVDLGGAVRLLGRLAASTIFQPEGGDPPVQVLGLIEATGLVFDHLWITGMTSEGWPRPVRAHPLLPLELQRAKKMPGAIVEVEFERARLALERLGNSAGEVVASHALHDGDRTLSPAAMVKEWEMVAPAPRATRALDVVGPAVLDSLPDAMAPALTAGRTVGGGVATLTDQSACPFRAFAMHRLASREPEQPHDGLAANERGELVHRVLAEFWNSLPERSRSFLAGMGTGERTRSLETAADKAIARLRKRRFDGPGDALLGIEKRRLVNLTSQWLQFEIERRAEFEVRWTEERRTLAIGPLSLTGQLDRVDRLADGRTIVIDYKTGGPSSATTWLGSRPDEPQLPLYLVASEPDARGIAFARLRAGEQRFVALTADDAMLPGAHTKDWTADFASWAALVDAWRSELARLANDFASGVAAVAPKRADTCRHCGVGLLCRYDERIGEATAEAVGEGDDDE